ncbi:MAG: hypothetical protein H6719_25130 [Sandaracinaceae bacterium]|nr:hypothetical protein [Sandaracinaceae bacterium]
MRNALLVLALLGGSASAARADVVDSDAPPLQCDELPCPAGSRPASLGHSSCPSVCSPSSTCTGDADCADYGAGARCEPTRFCIGIEYSGPGASEAVYDACESSGPCGSGATEEPEAPRCVEASRCVAPAGPATPARAESSRGGCAGCAASGRDPAGLGWLVALVALVAARRRR